MVFPKGRRTGHSSHDHSIGPVWTGQSHRSALWPATGEGELMELDRTDRRRSSHRIRQDCSHCLSLADPESGAQHEEHDSGLDPVLYWIQQRRHQHRSDDLDLVTVRSGPEAVESGASRNVPSYPADQQRGILSGQ